MSNATFGDGGSTIAVSQDTGGFPAWVRICEAGRELLMTPESARSLALWILENVRKPEEK